MPLPIKAYFDEATFASEKKNIFSKAPQFVGMESMVPEIGSYQVLERFMNTKVLVRDPHGVRLLSNICLHRQSNILHGRGRLGEQPFRCPVHHWSYGLDGRLASAPLFDKMECGKFSLLETPLQAWNGLLFTEAQDLQADLAAFPAPLVANMDLGSFRFSRSLTETAPFNWKHYIDGFAEDYHVPFVHPGFNDFVDVESIKTVSQPKFCGQFFRLRSREYLETRKTTPTYRRWIELLLKQFPDALPEPGGMCLLYYPTCMIEWYPKFMIVTTLSPQSVGETLIHVDFYHDREVLENHPDLVSAAEATYAETGREDYKMCQQLADGRRGLYLTGQSETGPAHPIFERGLLAFHKFYSNCLA